MMIVYEIDFIQHLVPCYRCFSFGIGSGASTHLVKGIAQAGLGTAEFITSGERMQPKVCAGMQSGSGLFSGMWY